MQEELQDFLKQNLKDIQLPSEVGLWPLAPAWWLFAGALLFALILIAKIYYRQRIALGYRRIAVKSLKNAYQKCQQTDNIKQYLYHANTLLRRCILHTQANHHLVGNSGEAWIKVLNSMSKKELSEVTKEALTVQCYQRTPEVNLTLVHREIDNWIRNHRPPIVADNLSTTYSEATNV